MSCGVFTNLFCCPFLVSRIASKLAFWPPEATYDFTPADAAAAAAAAGTRYRVRLVDTDVGCAHEYGGVVPDAEGLYARTSRGRRIACVFVRTAGARRTILHSHSNASDLGQMCDLYAELGRRTNCHVFGYDYSGYGISDGRPSERDLYADVEAAWRALRTEYGVSPADIVLYGQSIGTVPTVHLASRRATAAGGAACAAVILHSPIMSGITVLFPTKWSGGPLNNIDKVSGIECPVLVVHGKQDKVVDISHAVAIHQRCPNAVPPLWVDGAAHDDLDSHDVYWKRLGRFFSTELLG